MPLYHPESDLKELFVDLHKAGVTLDGKSISDALLKESPDLILQQYLQQKDQTDFDIHAFYESHFYPSKELKTTFESDKNKRIEEHINNLWEVLLRQPKDEDHFTSRIDLPYPYIVPGGRFNEIYYWDSYFTMLGLAIHDRYDIITHMVDNFDWLIQKFGRIPNGNRTYFLSRSQPPFFSLMLDVLAQKKGIGIYTTYLPSLMTEYTFWIEGLKNHEQAKKVSKRVVFMEDGNFLNRYYDDEFSPRTEMYSDDLEMIDKSDRSAEELMLDIRAACESGWDFSSRWFDGDDLNSIAASNVIPVDLNCLLVHLEQTIARAYHSIENLELSTRFQRLADRRIELIRKYCWNDEFGYYFDYDFKKQEKRPAYTLAGAFPLFLNIASTEEADGVTNTLEHRFLRPGGMVTTDVHSGQQWDAPNGWAPLQWVAVKGLMNYGHLKLAKEIAERWTRLNESVFKRTGKLMEKYNVENLSLMSGGGEYPVQDGFGWTNGVYLALKNVL